MHQMKIKFNEILSVLVPSRLILAIGPFLIGTLLIIGFTLPNMVSLISGLIILSLADSSASAINSLSDTEEDKINKPERILAKKPQLKNEVLFIACTLFSIALIMSFFINLIFFIIILLRILFEILYSTFRLKKIFLINHLLVGITYGAIPLFASWAIFSKPFGYPPTIFYFFILMTIFLTPLKDIEDYWGDKKSKTKTLPVKIGLKKSILVFPIILIILPSTILIIGLIFQIYQIILASLISIIYLILLSKLTTSQINKTRKSKKSIKIFTPFATLSGVIIELIFVILLII